MAQLSDEVLVGRFLCTLAFPYFQAYNRLLIPMSSPNSRTMSVDRHGYWYVNDEVVKTWSSGEIATGIAHEIIHLISNHPNTFTNRDDHFTANIAADMAVNGWLRQLIPLAQDELKNRVLKQNSKEVPVLKLIEGAIYPDMEPFKFEVGLTAEEYFSLLKAKYPNEADLAEALGYDVIYIQDNKNESGSESGNGPKNGKKPGLASGGCGSCANGHKKSNETGDSDQGISEAEMKVYEREIAKQITEYQKSRGNMPAGILRWANGLLTPPKVPWQTELQTVTRFAIEFIAGMVDSSWKRISRRSTDVILMPGSVRPKPNIAIVVDTSGSMGEKDINLALSEMVGIFKAFPGRIPILVGDAEFDTVQYKNSPSSVTLKGGGGTDMRIGINKALSLKPKPDIIVILTDGFTPWPSDNIPGKKLIAVLTNEDSKVSVPDFIKYVYIG